MGWRDRRPQPQRVDDEFIRRFADVENRLRLLEQTGPTSVQIIDYEDYDDPSLGEVHVNWPGIHREAMPSDPFVYFHDGKWRGIAGGAASYEIKVFADDEITLVKDTAFDWPIPESLDGAEIIKLEAALSTPDSADTLIQVRHLVNGTPPGTDILSTKIKIGSGLRNSKDSTPQPVISGTGSFVVAHGDHLRCDVDAAGGAGMGLALIVTLVASPFGSIFLEGIQGVPGEPGGITSFSGQWTTATSYGSGQSVSNNGSSYVSTAAHTSGATTEPGVGANWQTVWQVLAEGGSNAAVDVTVADAGSFYTGTDVEAVLQELPFMIPDDASELDIIDVGAYYAGSTVEDALQEIGAGGIGGGGGGASSAFIGVRAERTSTQTITTSTETPINFNAADAFDSHAFHDTATNNTRITIPTGMGGTYLIVAQIDWASSGTGDRVLYIKKNNTTYPGTTDVRAATSFGSQQQTVAIVELAAGDYVEAAAYHTNGSNLNVVSGSFSATRLVGSGAGIASDASVCAYRTATTTVATSTTTAIPFDAENYDTDAFHDLSTNTSRLTVPAGKSGRYNIFGFLWWDTNTTGNRNLLLRKNGTTVIGEVLQAPIAAGLRHAVAAQVDLVAGDYIELCAWQDSGGTRTVGAASTPQAATMMMSQAGTSGGAVTDGWTPASETWTYASATTFTVSGDLTSRFTKGTRIKLTQTTAKYFVVTGSSFSAGTTTVTVTGGSDYSLANAAITLPYYSYQVNPQGWPGWFNYDCAPTGFSGTPTQRTSRFRVVGNTCFCYIDITGTSNATTFGFSLPVSHSRSFEAFAGQGSDNGANPTSPYLVSFGTAPASTVSVFKTWASGAFTASGTKAVQVSFFYEF